MENNNTYKSLYEIFDILINCDLDFTLEDGKLIPPKDLNAAKNYISSLIMKEKEG